MNMSYCRFQNTALDLQDCVNNWVNDEYDNDDEGQLSPDEQEAKERIIELAKEILQMECYRVDR